MTHKKKISMKKISLYIASLGLAAVAFSACDNEFERPPMALPISTWEANTTIAQLKQDYWNLVDGTPAAVGLTANGDSVIIKGRVISSDASGNIFKYLMIQDEEEAIALTLDFYDINQSYKFGQEVFINATGLTIGGYGGLMCLGNGVDDRGRVARCAEAIFTPHAQVNGLPNTSLIDTITTTITTVNEALATAEGKQKWQSQLIRIDNVRFEDAGDPFAVGTSSISRYIIDEDGNRIMLYNSTYADFANQPLPYGYGSIVGILSYFSPNGQILLNDINGCIGFDGVATPVFTPGAGAVKPGTEVTITCKTEEAVIHYTLDGSQPTASSDVYTAPFVINEDVTIKAIATRAGHDASIVVTARYTVSENAPTEGDGTEEKPYNVAQIIELNPTSTSDAVASDVWTSGYIVGYMPTGGSSTLLSAAVFGIGGDVTDLNLVIAASPDENNAANCIGIQLPAAIRPALNLKDNPGNLGKLLTIKGGVFKYCGGPGIKNGSEYKLDGEGSTVTPEPPVGGTVYSSLSEDDAELAAGWTIDNVNIGSLEAVWSWKIYNNKGYLNASAYSSEGNTVTEAYAVSPVIDLTGVANPSLSFDHAAKFQTTLKTLCGVCIREEGTSTWTTLSIPTWPQAGAWTFVNSGAVSMKDFAGKKVQVAFKYGSSTEGADTWEIKNLVVTDAN